MRTSADRPPRKKDPKYCPYCGSDKLDIGKAGFGELYVFCDACTFGTMYGHYQPNNIIGEENARKIWELVCEYYDERVDPFYIPLAKVPAGRVDVTEEYKQWLKELKK